MAWATAQEALSTALGLPGLGHLEIEERPERSAAIIMVEETRRDEVVVGTKSEIEQVWTAKEVVLGHLSKRRLRVSSIPPPRAFLLD